MKRLRARPPGGRVLPRPALASAVHLPLTLAACRRRLERLGLHIARLMAVAGGLFIFSQAFLPHLLIDSPCEMHERLCAELDQAMQGGRRLIGALPREHAKTTLGTVALVLREVVRAGSSGPRAAEADVSRQGRRELPKAAKRNILIIGANAQEARVKLRQIVHELESNPLLRAGFKPLCAPARDRKGQLVAYTDGEIVLSGGTRISTLGFGGKVRGQLSGGRRLDLVILDDPEDDRSVESPLSRQRLRRWVDTALLNALDVHTGSLVWLGTLLHHDSVLAQLLAEREGSSGRGGNASTWRSIREAALDDNNNPLWPGRWSYEALMLRRSEIGSRAFAQEYLNQPQSLEERIFIDSQWRQYNPEELALCLGQWEFCGQPLRTVIGVDPAIGEERQHDYYAAAVLGLLPARDADEKPQACVLAIERCRLPFARQLDSLRLLAARWLPAVVGIESIAYQAALKQSAFELGLPAVEMKGTRSKAARIETLAALVEAGRILLPAHGPWVARFREEAAEYPSGKHDDQLDAVSRALEAAQLLPGGGEAFGSETARAKARGF